MATTDNNETTITEGSIRMTVPSGDESKVFYNPVQVQNRDLSILMITLAGERRAMRRALQQKEKEIKQAVRQEALGHLSEEAQKQARRSVSALCSKDNEAIARQLDEFRASLQTSELVSSLDPKCDGICILDALAASGLRSLRYWKEIPNVKHVTINDIDAVAVERAHRNVADNGLQDCLVQPSEGSSRPYGIQIQTGDALLEMYASRTPPMKPSSTGFERHPNNANPSPWSKPQWDVIDLDPYGSAAPFLDAAVQGIASGGLLCITCTDMAALGGAHPETCFGRYAGMPIQRAGYLQEVALRILLHAIASSAARYGRTIHPLLSVGMDFYVRVFVEVNEDKAGVSQWSLHTGHVFQSTNSPLFHIVPAGQLGGKKNNVYQAGRLTKEMMDTLTQYKVGGPLWLGPLHDKQVVGEALKRLEHKDGSIPDMGLIASRDRIRGLLESCRDELEDAPLFYKLPDLTKAIKLEAFPMASMQAALRNAGFRVSGYHKEPQAVKTNAPNDVILDILRTWAESHPPKKALEAGSFASHVLSTKPSRPIDFSIPKGGLGPARSVARFPQNPTSHWGPKRAATGNHKRKADELTAAPHDE